MSLEERLAYLIFLRGEFLISRYLFFEKLSDHAIATGSDRAADVARLQREDESLSTPLVDGLPYTGAHLVYGVKAEMAQTLADLLIRRTHIAFEDRQVRECDQGARRTGGQTRPPVRSV